MIFLGTKDGTVYRGMNRTISVKEPINVTDNNITFLFQNYPNPFNPTTTIKYSIPKDEFVKLTVYDVTGKNVKELVNGHKSAGVHSVEFNANNYASGTYYYRLEAGGYKDIKR
jgi:flagellar hook assembly protein FlgD